MLARKVPARLLQFAIYCEYTGLNFCMPVGAGHVIMLFWGLQQERA